jgi:hypothetical protein
METRRPGSKRVAGCPPSPLGGGAVQRRPQPLQEPQGRPPDRPPLPLGGLPPQKLRMPLLPGAPRQIARPRAR